MYKIKLQNVCDPYIKIYLLRNEWGFFGVFINHFPRIHRGVLGKIADLLYF